MSKPPRQDIDESELHVGEPKQWAAGIPGVLVSLQRGIQQMGPGRTVRALRVLNQREGFDCPGCAWPEPQGHRKLAEFCENGAKAVAEEATTRRVGPEFFARHPVAELAERTDYWLGQQGRITHPMVLRPGGTHYEPISWDEAFDLIATELSALDSPNEAVFYTSGRTSNEAAFLYQLLVRSFGTNNLPDCSNMCHESSGAALNETIGIGKGSVSLADLIQADLIMVVGQNPGTNHPRMLSALEQAKGAGARVVAVNPLPEAGLMRFKNPQNVRGVLGRGTPLADEFCQIRLGGDLALFQAIGHLLVSWDADAPGTVLDAEFLREHAHGFAEYAEHVRALDWALVEEATGLDREQITKVARMVADAERVVVCWAMGLTQHRQSVPAIREIVNVMLLRGMIGKPGAGLCPVRGHSNVQGDRTMGIWEKMPESFLAALEREFGITVPREHGYDTVAALRAMRDGGPAKVFMGLGGNFVSATPDTEVTERALRSCRLTVQVSTKLNRSHVVPGRTALILPTLGRTERDVRAGRARFVTVEDSMSVVHRSRGRLAPASEHLRSEVSILCGLARRLFGPDHPVPWELFERDYDEIRERIARVVPGCADYNRKVRQPDGFVLPHPPRDAREFPTATGRANLTVNPIEVLRVPAGRLLLQTMRSHDQYNTTIYGLDDRYRGVKDGRRVVLVSPADLAELGLAADQLVDLVSEWPDDPTGVTERRAERFRVVAYPTARGCAAAYFPEANALVPLDSVAQTSNTPTSKSIVVRLEPVA
ncbi:FdhF/YdeP family oxidoreductase [Goodfellowiella coeruleoviolacea]|uniref:Oxidoreductase alpha (Molybdopterin) subunit n=1 Tax=Goodfellowiella coeruleoviolacea TaxID=334858 RepID=A0AAE3KG48_9PSEU|nr:FdhF/YdeP family oxidoreductase [Goodfellowiella coeruleoviolacea]MCP2165094.1 oxidoreductase alpha (molybdopterin) subunit [Goodfellowiella coeruleoviolacea]